MALDANISAEYRRWTEADISDGDVKRELLEIANQPEEIFDRFYRNLEFGTGGLRGVIGAGTNRMNVLTVAKASQGLSAYLKEDHGNPSVCIAYDSRIKSTLFAKTAASVMAANGVRVYLFPELMPTPALSHAVRYYQASGGIVITASHNPAKYNGYKVYGADGCQITLDAANRVLAEIEKIDLFADIHNMDYDSALTSGMIAYIGPEVTDDYMRLISKQTIHKDIPKDVSIVYTPLNGAGLKCVTRALRENGFTNISVVPEQRDPDGNFPTCPYPNPEIREALQKGLAYAQELGSDLLLATDPDCDRVGIAVKQGEDYRLLTGNQVGVLLLDYICKSRIACGSMPQRPIAIKTIVTTELAAKIAQKYGVELINVLTGFKFIGEQIGYLESRGEDARFIFGFEESYGYLTGSYVRDKDGVDASLMICEMFAYYRAQGLSLIDALLQIYREHGCFVNALDSYSFEGAQGFAAMQRIMQDFREAPKKKLLGKKLTLTSDYMKSEAVRADGSVEKITLPKSNVLKFDYEGDVTVVARPSGTEPKIKFYFSVKADTLEESEALTAQIRGEFGKMVDAYRA